MNYFHSHLYIFFFQALDAELISHEPVIIALVGRGQQMVQSGHFAAQQIEINYSVLQEKMSQLKEQSKIRKQKLLDAYESQMVSTCLISLK